MSKGFQIEMQDGLTSDEQVTALSFIDGFISKLGDGGVDYGRLTNGSYRRWALRRNVLGYVFGKSGLVFRRVSKNRRVFAVVRLDTLEQMDGSPVSDGGCRCIQCNGGTRVRWKDGTKPPMSIVLTRGIIKG